MPVQSGTATPWREIEDPSVEDGSSVVVYMRPGEVTGSADLLAEQLRADGLIQSLGPAIRMAGEAELRLGWFGTDEDEDERLCDEDGWTHNGGQVDGRQRCVLARIDLSEA